MLPNRSIIYEKGLGEAEERLELDRCFEWKNFYLFNIVCRCGERREYVENTRARLALMSVVVPM